MDCEEFLNLIPDCYKYFDPAFMADYIAIVNLFYKGLQDKDVIKNCVDVNYFMESFHRMILRDSDIDIRESVSECLSFFKELNSSYYSMAISAVNQTDIKKGDPQDSSIYQFEFSNGKFDASTLCHEITHAFTISKDQVFKDQYPKSPIMFIMSEINSYVMQFLYYQFLLEKKDKELFPADMIDALMDVVILKENENYWDIYRETFEIICNDSVWDSPKKVLDLFALDDHCDYINITDEYNVITSYLSHPFGIMVASYIYLKILENPENIKLFLGVEKAQGIEGKEEITLRSLEALGLPCVHDGKLSLHGDCVSIFVESLSRVFEICGKHLIGDMPKLFSNSPLIKEEYLDEVNQVFEREELEEDTKKQKQIKLT